MADELTSLHERELHESTAYDPFLRGDFPVGVRTLEARDNDRDRLFAIEVWYPAGQQHAGQDVAPETQDVFVPRSGTPEQRQCAVRDAAPLPGIYPLLIFSHHSLGHRRVSSFLCTHLSSHGYIVASLDHSEVVVQDLARPASETEDQKNARWRAVIDSRVPDVEFLIDHLLSGGLESEARIDRQRIGIAGHSFGAWTALATPEVVRRIVAVVALAPGGTRNPRAGVLPVELTFQWGREVPALYLVAENDVPLPLPGMYELFDRAPHPKRMVILRRADHAHFVDNVEQSHEAFRTMASVPPEIKEMQKEMLPISDLCTGKQAHLWVRGLTLAHMDAYLKQQHEAQQFLSGDIEGELARRGVEVILRRAPGFDLTKLP